MNLKRTTIISTLAFAALAAVASPALAHEGHNQGNQGNHGDRGRVSYEERRKEEDHRLFHEQEAARRAVQDQERANRAQRIRAKFERERRDVIRRFGYRSPEYRGFMARWERRWNTYVAQERVKMIQQRKLARQRHQQYHLAVDQYEYLSLNDSLVDRDLFSSGFQPFPGERMRGYGDDNRLGRRNYRDIDDVPELDWNFGFGISVRN